MKDPVVKRSFRTKLISPPSIHWKSTTKKENSFLQTAPWEENVWITVPAISKESRTTLHFIGRGKICFDWLIISEFIRLRFCDMIWIKKSEWFSKNWWLFRKVIQIYLSVKKLMSTRGSNISKSPNKSDVWPIPEDKLKILIRIRPVLNEE
jgi:hypothetical protein